MSGKAAVPPGRKRAKLFPLFDADAVKSFDHLRVEMLARAAIQFRGGFLVALPLAVDAVADDGVEGVGDGEDARFQINLGAAEALRLAGAVPFLVVLRDDPRRAL